MKGKRKEGKGEGKCSGSEEKIKCTAHDRVAPYLSDLTTRASEASFRNLSTVPILQGESFASILQLEALRLKKRERFPEYT